MEISGCNRNRKEKKVCHLRSLLCTFIFQLPLWLWCLHVFVLMGFGCGSFWVLNSFFFQVLIFIVTLYWGAISMLLSWKDVEHGCFSEDYEPICLEYWIFSIFFLFLWDFIDVIYASWLVILFMHILFCFALIF